MSGYSTDNQLEEAAGLYVPSPPPSAADSSFGAAGSRGKMSLGDSAMTFLDDYARDRPEVVAMWAFGLGFVLAWKLKPW